MPPAPISTRPGYTLGSPTRLCAATGRALETGEAYVATLVRADGPEEYRRTDFSLDAWNAGARPRDERGRRLPVLGSWRSVVPEAGAKRQMLVDDGSLLDMFEESGLPEGAGDGEAGSQGSAEDRAVFRFILALILLRKRLLVCDKTESDGTMLVRPRGSAKPSEGGTLAEVRDPGLGEDSIARVVGQLAALLDDGVPGVGSTPGGGAA